MNFSQNDQKSASIKATFQERSKTDARNIEKSQKIRQILTITKIKVHPSKFPFQRGVEMHVKRHRKSQKPDQFSVEMIIKVYPSKILFQE